MKKSAHLPIPVAGALRKVGSDISAARRRRRIGTTLMAERADLSRTTLRKIEQGDATVSMGHYATTLFVLGMEDRLKDLVDGTYDLVSRKLEDKRLPKRIHIPRQYRG